MPLSILWTDEFACIAWCCWGNTYAYLFDSIPGLCPCNRREFSWQRSSKKGAQRLVAPGFDPLFESAPFASQRFDGSHGHGPGFWGSALARALAWVVAFGGRFRTMVEVCCADMQTAAEMVVY